VVGVICSVAQLYVQVNSSTFQLSLTPPIYRFDKTTEATTSLTPGAQYPWSAQWFGWRDLAMFRRVCCGFWRDIARRQAEKNRHGAGFYVQQGLISY
jgi:hypothetical protein